MGEKCDFFVILPCFGSGGGQLDNTHSVIIKLNAILSHFELSKKNAELLVTIDPHSLKGSSTKKISIA